MTHWTDKRAAKAELSNALRENGWKIYGYKADESDMMTDYWSPASWDGIAEKNGFVLVVDQYSTSYSGYEVKQYNYNKTRSTSSKVSKLQATVNDKAATVSEKESAQKLIDKLNAKDTTPDYEVLEVYPTFEHKTPRACIWHIEKDGIIIAKGKGLYSLYSINDRDGTKQKMKAFVDKLEKHIADDSELVPVEKKIKAKVTEVITIEGVTVKDFEKGATLIKLNAGFTGGFYSGTILAYNDDFGDRKTFLKLGKKYQKLKNINTNWLTLKVSNLEKWIEDGSISIVELKEVETVTTKVVYEKRKRTKKPVAEEFQVETNIQAETVETAPEAVETVDTVQESNGITYKLNEEKNGVEIYFDSKPSEEVRDELKLHGFRWSRYTKAWYAKQSQNTIALAKKLSGVETASETISETVEKFKYELPEYVDITQYTINVETEKRLIDNSLFGDMRKVGYETKQLQDTLQNVLDETVLIVSMTDNSYYKKKLIEGFNSFCERYSREMNSYLYSKSVSPSWAVTGRGNIDPTRYNKKQDRVFNKMGKVVEILQKQRDVLQKYKNKFKSEQVAKLKAEIKHGVESNAFTCDFKTEKRKINYYGYTYDTRAYISDNYFIMKLAGCYRIFENETTKEVYSMKTTEKLPDAKAYIMYLEAQKLDLAM